MKKSLLVFTLLLTMLSFLACTQPPIEEEAEVRINVYGIYPGPDNTYSILVSKSLYDQENYQYIDSLLFIQIDTAGNEIACPGFGTEDRPNLKEFHLLDNGNIMIFGNMSGYHYSYGYSTWEYSPLGVLQWEMEMTDMINGVVPSQDGNLFIFGRDQSHGLDNNILYLKIELDGDTLWDYRIPTNHYNTSLSGGTPTSDNGCIAIGSIWLNNRSTDILVARIDVDGDTLWTGAYGGDGYDRSRMVSELSDGSILIVGEINLYDSTNTNWNLNSGQQVYLIKLSANGDKLWTRAIGNTLRESPNAIIEASDGSLILLGTRDQSHAYLYDETTGWISKLSADGEEIWIQEFEGKLPMGVRELPKGYLLVVTQNLNEDYWYRNADDLNIMKLNSSGTLLWNRVLTP